MAAPLIDSSGSRAESEATTFEDLGLSVSVLAVGLDTPWDLVWGPDDHLWVTERVGRVLRIDPSTGDLSNGCDHFVARAWRKRSDGDGLSPRF
jgi:glucose/arabinose dehydrogenase